MYWIFREASRSSVAEPGVTLAALTPRAVWEWQNRATRADAVAPSVLRAAASVQIAVRKAGHMCGYAVLTVLVWRASNGPDLGRVRPWPARLAWTTWGLAVAYAASDEFHQSFVPSREGSPRDVAIDAAGAALAVGLVWCVGQIRRRWR